ncbi:hypothetical protein K461DRAFT_33033 [Myriangium duriaei CBS 260.36]|uniref:Uncharacterized protein n=1 Tax=Myriangium duriaei CBS 260.36 TaxID=1168546 RepID=A0A9P4ME91_9PEZI|nr:hypothetical protein K461DRAFT_33033 [Myriangium duriaei CBS 260.36]
MCGRAVSIDGTLEIGILADKSNQSFGVAVDSCVKVFLLESQIAAFLELQSGRGRYAIPNRKAEVVRNQLVVRLQSNKVGRVINSQDGAAVACNFQNDRRETYGSISGDTLYDLRLNNVHGSIGGETLFDGMSRSRFASIDDNAFYNSRSASIPRRGSLANFERRESLSHKGMPKALVEANRPTTLTPQKLHQSHIEEEELEEDEIESPIKSSINAAWSWSKEKGGSTEIEICEMDGSNASSSSKGSSPVETFDRIAWSATSAAAISENVANTELLGLPKPEKAILRDTWLRRKTPETKSKVFVEREKLKHSVLRDSETTSASSKPARSTSTIKASTKFARGSGPNRSSQQVETPSKPPMDGAWSIAKSSPAYGKFSTPGLEAGRVLLRKKRWWWSKGTHEL